MTTLPSTKLIITNLQEGWLRIEFNSPHNRNALSKQLCHELRLILQQVRQDKTIRGVTLSGRNGVFCAGGDLKEFQKEFHTNLASYAEVKQNNQEIGDIFSLLNTLPQVVVILVEGAAIAGGLGLVCCGDVVVVMDDTKFSLTETKIGIPPAQITPFVVKRLGITTARRIILTGTQFTGKEAQLIGLANFCVTNTSELEQVETKIRRDVLSCSPQANAIAKEILLASSEMNTETLSEYAADKFAQAMLGEEGREGIASFVEKRKPYWTKKDKSL